MSPLAFQPRYVVELRIRYEKHRALVIVVVQGRDCNEIAMIDKYKILQKRENKRRSLTKSLNDIERQESVGPPIGGGVVPAHVQAPNMEADGEADVNERDGDRSTEPLHEDPNEASLCT